jgi:hypothetical protein
MQTLTHDKPQKPAKTNVKSMAFAGFLRTSNVRVLSSGIHQNARK